MKRYILSLALLALAACEATPLLPVEEPRASAALTVQEGILTGADGVPLRYRVVGTGPDTVVVLHGGPSVFSSSYLVDDLAPLAAGRTLIHYDQRGAGRSGLPADMALVTVERHVADLEAVREHFGLEEMKLVGHSWGAMLAAFYTAAHPGRVERLALLNPGPIDVPLHLEFLQNRGARITPEDAALQEQMLTNIFTGNDPVGSCEVFFGSLVKAYMADPSAVARFRGEWCDVTPERAQDMWFSLERVVVSLGLWDLRPLLAEVAVPALVVHGTGDPIPFASSQAWAASIPGARLEVIDGTGHFPWLENPVAVFTTLDTFLRREGGA